MRNRKILISSKQYNLLKESEWNIHFGKEHNGKPYVSDNKFQMLGRETGHFGSGTYFSTYKNHKDIDRYTTLNRNQNPNFIEIDNHVYRVDFDIYKNLYRVRSQKQGDILYTMLKNLNIFYNRITTMGEFNPKQATYDNSTLYQIIYKNATALNLKCPTYLQLTRMAQNHQGNQSFSTVFMEWNGYNGVNVSGVDYYDNTKHGSVIYDLSKTNDDMEEVNPKSLYTGFKDSSYDNTIASDGFDDDINASINGEYITWYGKLNSMPLTRALRLLKNYTESGHILNPFIIKDLKPELIKKYLRLIFTKQPHDDWGYDMIQHHIISGEHSKYFTQLINQYNAYYYINYIPQDDNYSYDTVLTNLLYEFHMRLPWNLNNKQINQIKQKYLKKLLSYLNRKLTTYEQNYINNDFFEEEND